MDNKTKCDICGNKGKRLCPAINGMICSTCCGSKRNSEIICTSDCPHSPFSTTGYDLWLKVDGTLPPKYMNYIISNYGRDKFEELVEDMSFEEEESEDSLMIAAGSAAYNVLFVEQDKHGMSLADKWELQGFEGLNNDEKVMMKYLKNSRVTIIEIQKILDHQAMECIDILEPESKPFILYDRSTASRAIRFSKFFSWLTHFPNFSRSSHGGIEIIDFIADEFIYIIKDNAKRESKKNRNFKLKDYLSKNFGGYCQLSMDLAHEKHKRIFNAMDVHQCIAVYDIKTNKKEIEEILEKKPDFQWEDNDLEENDPPDTLYYSWLRRGESKAIEKDMPSFFRHKDESMGVGTLANIRLYHDKLVIEAFTKQKYEFAKKMVTRYFGLLVTLRNEKIVDLAKQIIDRPSNESTEKKINEKLPISPEDEQKIMKLFYENSYKRFLDEEIPAIDNKTPREASKNPKLRPKLINLMKTHIKGIEKMNRDKGIDVNIDWILDELGLSELK